MKAGKISESILKRSVLKEIHKEREDVLISAAVGEDCAAVEMSTDCAVSLTCDPVMGPVKDAKLLAKRLVLKVVNNLASSGSEPVGLMVSVLLPTSANEQDLRQFMETLSETCAAEKLQILGGHTEVTRAVNELVVTATGVGRVVAEQLLATAKVEPGMDIIATKAIALQGTVRLVNEKESELREHFTQPFLDKAKKLVEYLPIRSEAAVASKSGASAMHDASEGGIFAALWEFAESSGVGLEIDLKKIPIRQETVEICEYLGVNPYKLLATGCLLIAAKDGNHIVRELEKAGIEAVVIGKATDNNDRVLINEDERRFLETPQLDEIYSIL